jgi:neutral ceramidase
VDKLVTVRSRPTAPAFTGRARTARRVRVPIGAWSTFANHGTVTKSSFEYYNADHHASALRVFEQQVRRHGRVPGSQEVLNVYGNSAEGDMSAGLDRHGPAASDHVGRVEAAAMLRAWRRAGAALSRSPELDVRWTRMCFCGRQTDGGRVAERPEVGIPFLTGSEEERGPLYDVTGEHFEGVRAPVATGPHGHKLYLPGASGVPDAVPLLAVRVGPGLIVSVPGEGTKEVGARIRADVERAIAGSDIGRVVVSGLANEFVLYFTTPEEYARQHYEGGNTHFGTYSSNLLKAELARLAGTLVRGEPAPPPHPFDPTNGVSPDGPAYGSGAASGSLTAQPARRVSRLGHAEVSWRGGPQGLDRPLDRAFVVVERRRSGRWTRAADDLGLAMLWEVDEEGRHRARWEVPLRARLGRYRFTVRAKRYRLVSRAFRVVRSRAVVVHEVPAGSGRVAVELRYPAARRDVDLTARPPRASGGLVDFRVGGETVRVSRRSGATFGVAAPAGASVSVPAGAARDRFGNVNRRAVSLR